MTGEIYTNVTWLLWVTFLLLLSFFSSIQYLNIITITLISSLCYRWDIWTLYWNKYFIENMKQSSKENNKSVTLPPFIPVIGTFLTVYPFFWSCLVDVLYLLINQSFSINYCCGLFLIYMSFMYSFFFCLTYIQYIYRLSELWIWNNFVFSVKKCNLIRISIILYFYIEKF